MLAFMVGRRSNRHWVEFYKGAYQMPCVEHEQQLHDVESCRNELTYYLFRRESHLLSKVTAKQFAYKAAFALARAINRLHLHEVRCALCRKGVNPIGRV
jgi:hypothetical protein